MSIFFNEKTRLFHLQSSNTSYTMQIFRDKYLVRLYWGRKIRSNNLGYLMRTGFRPFNVNPDPEDRNWSLENLLLEYPWYGNSDFRSPAFSVRHPDGSTISDLAYKSHKIYKGKSKLHGLPATYVETENEAETLEIELFDELAGLGVILSYTVFEVLDVIIRSACYVNAGKSDLRLLKCMSMCVDFDNMDFEMLQLSGAWARERYIIRRKLVPGYQSVESKLGASSHQQNPFIALLRPGANEECGDVYGFSLVYSGSFEAGVEVDHFNCTRVLLGINSFDFEWCLNPGERFQTPEVVMVFSSNGIGGMSRTFHSLYRTRLCRGEYRDKVRPLITNNWEATTFNFTADKIEGIARIGKEIGLELMVLDDGWFGKRDDSKSSLGDWYEDRRKLPQGLKGMADTVNQIGLDFGLWVEPEMISPDSDLYRKHPDWCLHVAGRGRNPGRNQLVLDLTRKDVCDSVIEMISGILNSAPITYIKWDFNRPLTEMGSSLLPPERQRETAHRYVLGLYRIMEELVTAFPKVLFEGCASGGGRFDPGFLYYMPQTWTSDSSDAVERIKVQYGTSIVYPAITMGAHVSDIPNITANRITPLETRFAVAASGNFGYQLDLTKLTVEEKELYSEHVKIYKEIRELVQFGNLYRLKSPFEGNEAAWMFVSTDKKEAFAVYIRMIAQCNEPLTRVLFKGLDEETEYEVVGESSVFTGETLMYAGMNVPPLKGDFACCTWRLKGR